MVVLTGVAVGAIIATGGAAAPVVAEAGIGAIGAAGSAGGVVTTGAAVAGSAAAGASAGAVTGAASAAAAGGSAAATMGAAASGTVIGGATAGGVASSGAGAAGLATTGVALGPVGWIALGASSPQCTFDCYKPVLRMEDPLPSRSGMLLKDVLGDPRIKNVQVSLSPDCQLPAIRLQNIWDETFQIEYVVLPNQQVAAHAVRID